MTSTFGFPPLRSAAVETHAHGAGFHVATANDEHGVDAQFFRVGILALNSVALKSESTHTLFARSSATMSRVEILNLCTHELARKVAGEQEQKTGNNSQSARFTRRFPRRSCDL